MLAHLRHVASLGFQPATVIDVGAAEGTPPLYVVFPKAFHGLVEPLRDFEPQLKELTDRLGGTYRIAAANDTGEPVSFNVAVAGTTDTSSASPTKSGQKISVGAEKNGTGGGVSPISFRRVLMTSGSITALCQGPTSATYNAGQSGLL